MVVGHSGIVLLEAQVRRSMPTKPTSSKSTRGLAGQRKLEASEWNEELRAAPQEALRGSQHDGPSSRYGESRIAQEGQGLRGPHVFACRALTIAWEATVNYKCSLASQAFR